MQDVMEDVRYNGEYKASWRMQGVLEDMRCGGGCKM
jgi:hypothetical protein